MNISGRNWQANSYRKLVKYRIHLVIEGASARSPRPASFFAHSWPSPVEVDSYGSFPIGYLSRTVLQQSIRRFRS